jgi:uncharacterized lipoprotein YddW (UPF0748 family)
MTASNRIRTRVARLGLEPLEERVLLAGLNRLLDSFVYADAATAQAAWVAQEQASPVSPATGILGQAALGMTANFSQIVPAEGTTEEIAAWDRAFSSPLDLSPYSGFEIGMVASVLSPITGFTVAFRTGADDWYRVDIGTSRVSTTAWSTIAVDLKAAVVADGGTAGVTTGWEQIERIRIAAHAAAGETVDATFYVCDLKATGQEQIDSFVYASAAQAQTQWQKLAASAGPVTPAADVAGRAALEFPMKFATVTTDQRAYWDRAVDIDLSWARGVQFLAYSADPAPISSISLYFATGQGWTNYYTTSFHVAEVGAWNAISIDLAAASVTGSPQWSKISKIRLSPWRGQNIDTSLYLSDMRVFGGSKSIDGFEYASDAAAQAAWQETASPAEGPAGVAKNLQGGRAVAMPVKFSAATSDPQFDAATWERSLALDLTGQRGVQLDLLPSSLASVGSVTLALQSGDGWYEKTVAADELVAGQWNTITVERQEMLAEGVPGTWAAIGKVRFSVERDKSAAGTDSTVYLRDLRTLLPGILVIRQEPEDTTYAATVVAQLADAGVAFAGMGAADARADRLDRAQLLVLPYTESLPSAVTSALVASIQGGRKLLGFYGLPSAIYTAIGMTKGSYYGSSYAFGSIRTVDSAVLPGAPAIVNQASWNITAANPVAGQSSVIAWWYNTSGVNTGLPAIVGSDRGMVLTHVLLNDDLDNKERLLVSMADKLAPGTWASAAVEVIDQTGVVGPYTEMPAATAGIAATATANGAYGRTQPYLVAAAAARNTAQDDMTGGDYPAAFDAAVRSRSALRQAYSAAQNPVAGEMRAFFVHNPYGVPGQSWDTTIKQLADNGFNAVAVNLVDGGGAYYDSNVQAFSDGTMFPELYDSRGDQLELLVAATQKYGVDLYVWKTNWTLRWAPQWFVDRMRSEGRLQWDQNNSELFSGTRWLDPAVEANRALDVATMVELAGKPGVTGILFDYIRYPGASGSYSPASKAAFEEYLRTLGLLESGESAPWPATGVSITSSWTFYSQWVTWRQNNISDGVARVSVAARAANPNIVITAAVFRNWISDKVTVGQDWVSWLANDYLDSAIPMDYTSYGSQLDGWISSQQGWAPGEKIYPAITTSGNSSDRVVDQILVTRQHDTAGFYVFNLGSNEANSVLPTLGLGTTLVVSGSPASLDVDGNGTADALTDGILILRYSFDPAGAWNYSDALGAGATRTTRAGIRDFLDAGRASVLDVDGNGAADALTDGILILRYLFDPAGAWNYSDALGAGATRTSRAEIEAFLDQFTPGLAASSVAATAGLAMASSLPAEVARPPVDPVPDSRVCDCASVAPCASGVLATSRDAERSFPPAAGPIAGSRPGVMGDRSIIPFRLSLDRLYGQLAQNPWTAVSTDVDDEWWLGETAAPDPWPWARCRPADARNHPRPGEASGGRRDPRRCDI